jgi:hypothetical protein
MVFLSSYKYALDLYFALYYDHYFPSSDSAETAPPHIKSNVQGSLNLGVQLQVFMR